MKLSALNIINYTVIFFKDNQTYVLYWYLGYSSHIHQHQFIECFVNGNFDNPLYPIDYKKEKIEKCEHGVTHCKSIESIKPGFVTITAIYLG